MFDVLTIAAVADELAAALLDGRIQRIGLVGPLTLAAEIYAGGRRHHLVASAETDAARLHLTGAMPSLDPALVTPFGLLLRKYARGGVVVGVEQPPLERLVRISIAKRLDAHNGPRPRAGDRLAGDAEAPEPLPEEFADLDDADDVDDEGEENATYVHLAIELMGRHSNLILVDDDGLVMESAKRVTPAMSRVRPVLPRREYVAPPPIAKPDPRRMTAADAAALLASEPPNAELASVLIRRLRAVSPQMGREIAFRTAGDAKATVGQLADEAPTALARETRGLLEPLLTAAWSARVYRDEADAEVVAFAPVPMGHLTAAYQEEPVASISAAAELAFAGDGEIGPRRHVQRRERLLRSIGDARERLRGRLASLRTEAAKGAEVDRLRERGELIYAWLWQIAPGQTELVVDGTTVPLDPTVSAKENAQAYFERYRKAQSANDNVPELVARTETELTYLDQLATMVAQAEGFAELESLAAEWSTRGGSTAAAGRQAPTKRAAARHDKRPRPLLDRDGNAVYVGRTGAQNDFVTFDLAGPDDTWLHARGVPGSHVVVRWHRPGLEDDPETIEAAAALAAFYSSARDSARVEVDATKRRHVRKIKGAGPGMVTYRQERTLAVRPTDETGVRSVLNARQDGQPPRD